MKVRRFLPFLLIAVAAPASWALDLVVPPPAQTVRLDPGELSRVPLRDPVGTGEIVWALPYTLANDTGRNRDLVLEFILSTDQFRGIPVPAADPVPEKPEILIPRARFVPVQCRGGEHPLARGRLKASLGIDLLSQVEMQGAIRAGERKTGAVMFSGVPLDADRIELYVFGLSPVQQVELRSPRPGERDPRVVPPDHYRKLLTRGVPVVRLADPKDASEETRILPFVEPIDAREYGGLAKSGGSAAFERDGAFFKFLDPLAGWGEGTRLRQTWILRLVYGRVGRADRGTGDYTELQSREWLIGLSEIESR